MPIQLGWLKSSTFISVAFLFKSDNLHESGMPQFIIRFNAFKILKIYFSLQNSFKNLYEKFYSPYRLCSTPKISLSKGSGLFAVEIILQSYALVCTFFVKNLLYSPCLPITMSSIYYVFQIINRLLLFATVLFLVVSLNAWVSDFYSFPTQTWGHTE